MDIKKCKECPCCSIDTLADGTKEHYCYPPNFGVYMMFAIPCKNRSKSLCKKIKKIADKERKYFLGLQKKYDIDTSREEIEKFLLEKFGKIPQNEKLFIEIKKLKVSYESIIKDRRSNESEIKFINKLIENIRRTINET